MSVSEAGARPTPKDVDALVLEFVAAQAELQSLGAVRLKAGDTADSLKERLAEHMEAVAELKLTAGEKLDEVKARLVVMIDEHGFAHTESTTRIHGLLSKASKTVAKKLGIDDAAVETLHTYVEDEGLVDVAGVLFVKHVSYSLAASPAEILAPLDLKASIRKKIDALLAKVWRVTVSAPSIKIETMAAAGKKAA